jgi:WD40 repeat protein
MDDSGALFLPLVRWPNAPSASAHRVTCMSVSFEHVRTVATGSSSGSIVLWRLPFVEPHALLEGHSARVGALCDAKFEAVIAEDESSDVDWSIENNVNNAPTAHERDDHVVVSFADDGSVGLWRLVDGECVAFSAPHAIPVLSECSVRRANALSDRRTIVLGGDTSPTIVVFDAWKMQVIATVLRASSPLCAVDFVPSADALLLVHVDGTVAACTMAQVVASDRPSLCVSAATATAAAFGGALHSFSVATDGSLALMASARRLAVIASHGTDGRVLATADLPADAAGGGWTGALFLGSHHIACWDARGNLYLYGFNSALKQAMTATAKFGSGRASELAADVQAACAVELRASQLLPIGDVPIDCSPVVTVTCGAKQAHSIVLGTADGRLCVWRIAAHGVTVEEAPIVRPWNSAWAPQTQFAVRHAATATPAEPTNVTCSFVTTSPVGRALLLVCGHASGFISTSELPDTTATQQAANSLNRQWQAHTGAVLRLTAVSVHGTWYLISTGADCAVSVWLLKGGRHLHTFREHVLPVIGLRAMPPTSASVAKHVDGMLHVPLDTCFLTVSPDRAICIYSLAALKCVRRLSGHVAPIEAVWWRPTFDFVYVLCSDGALVIWELSTGCCQSSRRGEDVAAITADAELLWHAAERRSSVGAVYGSTAGVQAPFVYPVGLRFERVDVPPLAGITTSVPEVARCADVQLIVIDVREMLNTLRIGAPSALTAAATAAAAATTTNEQSPTKTTTEAAAAAVPTQTAAERAATADRMHLAMSLMSLLLPWGADTNVDRICREGLGLKRPLVPATPATFGAAAKMSLLLPTLTPTAAEGRTTDADVRSSADLLAHVWQSLGAYTVAGEITAMQNVAVCALLRLVLAANGESAASQAATSLLTYLTSVLPTSLPTYVAPSFMFLTLHYFDNDDDVAQTARALFAASMEVALARDSALLVREWAERFATSRSPHDRCLALLLLGVIGGSNTDLLTVELQRTIADELYMGVFRETGILQAACGELLASGYNTWCGHLLRPIDAEVEPDVDAGPHRRHNPMRGMFKRSTGSLVDVPAHADTKMLGARLDSVVLQLFCLSMAHDAVHLSSRRTARTARHALLQIGARDPRRFFAVLSDELTHPHKHTTERPLPYVDLHQRAPPPGRSGVGSLFDSLPARAPHARRRLQASLELSFANYTSEESPPPPATSMSAALAVTEPSPVASQPISSAMYGGDGIVVMVASRAPDRRLASSPTLSQHAPGLTATHALKLVAALVKNESIRLLPLLERIVEIAVRSLDPHVPHVRDLAMPTITRLLFLLVSTYPMVSFHQQTQRLALGTPHSSVIVYDLKAATKWHVLEGHGGAVAAVSFSENGRFVASYSYADKTVRVWSMATSFLGFGSPSCKTIHKINAVELAHDDVASLLATRLTWRSDSALRLTRVNQPDFDIDSA